MIRIICLLCLVGILSLLTPITVHATDTGDDLTDERTYEDDPGSSEDADDNSELNVDNIFSINVSSDNGSINGALRILLILTAIALAPMLLLMLTGYVRILIVLHFTRTALNTQTVPPNQVLIGLALFLTFYIMAPVFGQIYTEAIVPFDNGEIKAEEAYEIGIAPLREFMYKQTQFKDVSVFMEIAGYTEWDGDLEDIPTSVLIPSFILSELRTAFIIGFLIYVPFLVVDMVVSSVLMSMGMMMLPPTTISMPFKILLFVLADGWNLIIVNLVRTFY
ncbi:MAG: flagellar type III secretion system pore protein FliP [Lachnospiraceae bacterium]|nr:flagellar type III secretion system pore protein FliP [Lachnospiraceae bacterium]MCR5635240.1 flagellar type III secretion system pore protein FliP [Lachnospiraceae bacterium]